jgi:signal transduction histidine kinase
VRVAKSPGNLPQAVLDAAAYLEPFARRERCELLYEIDHDQETSLFDALAIQRVVENLITNAVKAVKETDGARSVRLRVGSGGPHYVLEVIDTGPGMSEFAVNRILSGTAVSRWTASSGTGLGTKVVRDLVAAMGGRMEIESTVGTGTTFRVFIPSERESAPL